MVVVGFSPRLPGGQRSEILRSAPQKKRALRREQPRYRKSIRFLAPKPNEVIVTKHRGWRLPRTDLDMILRANDIENGWIITGIATSGVVFRRYGTPRTRIIG